MKPIIPFVLLTALVLPSSVSADGLDDAISHVSQECAHLGFEAGRVYESDKMSASKKEAVLQILSRNCTLNYQMVKGWI